MDALNEYILEITDNTQHVKKWLEKEYKTKPLIIFGDNGIGKTHIAEYILKKYVKLYISINLCKKNLSLDEYLQSSLYKKSITMMFEPNNVYKSIIFDDLNDIHKNDKQLFKSIINFSKKKITNHPIIYIINSLDNKYIKQLWSKSYQLKLSYTYKQISDITNKFFLKHKISEKELSRLIKQSNYNFNSIKVNIDYYKSKFVNIQLYDKKNNNNHDFTKEILRNMKLNDVYRECSSDYSTIGLNILENTVSFICSNVTCEKEKINLLEIIYKAHCIGDNYLLYIHITNAWEFINHIIHNMIVYPCIMMKQYNMENINIKYNTYISKCIIATYHKKILIKKNLNAYLLSILYKLLYDYQNISYLSDRLQLKEKIKHIIQLYDIEPQIIIKFMKYYQSMYDLDYTKNTIQLFF